MAYSVYVGNLSYQMTEQELTEVFSSVGVVKSAKLIQDRLSGRSRGFGFVEFDTEEEMKRALELNAKEIKGRGIFVSEAKEKAESAGGGKRNRDQY
jgi:RNA recognition motif-containing protein